MSHSVTIHCASGQCFNQHCDGMAPSLNEELLSASSDGWTIASDEYLCPKCGSVPAATPQAACDHSENMRKIAQEEIGLAFRRLHTKARKTEVPYNNYFADLIEGEATEIPF